MHLFRVVVGWTGSGLVGTSVNVLHFDGSNQSAPPVAAIKTAYAAVAGQISANNTLVIPNSGDIIEDTDGTLQGVWNTTGGGNVAGTADIGQAAGVGACVGWSTGGIVTGSKGPRKLRGRTFIVPLSKIAYDVDGTLGGAALAAVDAFGTQLRAAGPLAVWHRPTSVGAANGNSYAVLSHKVRDKVAYLSSRRD